MWSRPHVTFNLVCIRAGRCAAHLSFSGSKECSGRIHAVKIIRLSMNILAQHPEVGRPVEEMEPEYREWPISFGSSGYIALYRFDGQSAIVVALRHQREAGF